MRTKYSRRTFLGWMAAAPLLAADNSYTGPIALQLYTLRNVIGTDVEGTLRKVAEIGYQEVEWAGFYNKTAKEIRSLLESVGLKGPSAHFNVFDARNRWNERMDFAREAGVRY